MTAPAERPPVQPWSVQLGTCWAIVHARSADDAKLKLLVRLGMTYIGQTEIDDEWGRRTVWAPIPRYPDLFDRMEAHEATPAELDTYHQIAAATTAPNKARRLALLQADRR